MPGGSIVEAVSDLRVNLEDQGKILAEILAVLNKILEATEKTKKTIGLAGL